MRDKDTPDDVAQKSLSTITTNQLLLLQHQRTRQPETSRNRDDDDEALRQDGHSHSLPPPRVYYPN